MRGRESRRRLRLQHAGDSEEVLQEAFAVGVGVVPDFRMELRAIDRAGLVLDRLHAAFVAAGEQLQFVGQDLALGGVAPGAGLIISPVPGAARSNPSDGCLHQRVAAGGDRVKDAFAGLEQFRRGHEAFLAAVQQPVP